jgi:hypothetical protein
LSCVFPSTHDKEIVCRAFSSKRTANIFPPPDVTLVHNG